MARPATGQGSKGPIDPEIRAVMELESENLTGKELVAYAAANGVSTRTLANWRRAAKQEKKTQRKEKGKKPAVEETQPMPGGKPTASWANAVTVSEEVMAACPEAQAVAEAGTTTASAVKNGESFTLSGCRKRSAELEEENQRLRAQTRQAMSIVTQREKRITPLTDKLSLARALAVEHEEARVVAEREVACVAKLLKTANVVADEQRVDNLRLSNQVMGLKCAVADLYLAST